MADAVYREDEAFNAPLGQRPARFAQRWFVDGTFGRSLPIRRAGAGHWLVPALIEADPHLREAFGGDVVLRLEAPFCAGDELFARVYDHGLDGITKP